MDATPTRPAEEVLQEAVANRAEAQRLVAARQRLEPALRAARETVIERKSASVKEQADADRLNRTLFARVLANLSGSLNDRQQRERAEANRARYALGEAEMRLQQLNREAGALDSSLAALGGLEFTQRAYESALHDVVARADADQSGPVVEEARGRLATLQRARELDEALVTGAEALTELKAARDRFGSADSWSTWDTFLGGGLLSSALKHEEMDVATEHLRSAAVAVERFSRELADVDLPGLAVPAVDGFDRTLDLFFDNVFTDIKVASHIRRALTAVDASIEQVEHTLARLADERARTNP